MLFEYRHAHRGEGDSQVTERDAGRWRGRPRSAAGGGWVWAWLAVALSGLAPAAAGPKRCTVYAYIDESGQLVKTVHRDRVPPSRRESLLTYRDCAVARALAAGGGQQVKPAPVSAARPAADEARPPAEVTAQRPFRPLSWFAGLRAGPAALVVLALAAGLAGTIGLWVMAFRAGPGWGLAGLLPPVLLVFAALHWRQTWPALASGLGGGAGAAVLLLWVFPWS
jgi:hypothetical protein